MTRDALNERWRLRLPDGRWTTFGDEASGLRLEKFPSFGSPTLDTDDQSRAQFDGVSFGVDVQGGQTIGFSLWTDAQDAYGARDLLAPLASAWRDPDARSAAGRLARLHAESGRFAYGRPRRFAEANDLQRHGVVRITADFATHDTFWRAPEQRAVVQLYAADSSGAVAPFVFPLYFAAAEQRTSIVSVAGDAPAQPIYTVRGPISRPRIQLAGGWSVQYEGSLLYDDELVFDTRTHAMRVRLNGKSVAGRLSLASARLSQMRLPVGESEVLLSGSSTGNPTLQVAWNDLYSTP